MNLKLGCAALSVFALVGCTQAPPPAPPDTREADAKAINDDQTAWNKDFAAKDVEKILGHYADEASLEFPELPILKTKDDMRKALKPFLDDANFSVAFAGDKVEVAKSGDLAYVQGHYTLTSTDPKTKKTVTEKGKYVTVYKKQADGSWKAVQDINNEDETPKS
jgi:ketosteroid isomerase-like protein